MCRRSWASMWRRWARLRSWFSPCPHRRQLRRPPRIQPRWCRRCRRPPPTPPSPAVALVETSANVEGGGDLDGGGTAAVVIGGLGAGMAAAAIAWLVRRKRNRARLMLTRRSSDPGTEVTSATAPTAPSDAAVKADVDVKVVVDATRRFSTDLKF